MTAAVVVGAVLGSAQPARASLWDWLQEFSGPGPFHARLPNFMFDICPQEGKDGRFLRDFEVPSADSKTAADDEEPPPVTCVFGDFRFFANDDDDNFGVDKVRVDLYETGASVRLHRAISLGFGGGLMRISTPNHTAYKGVLTAPRVVIKPLLLYGSASYWQKHRARYAIAGMIKYYVKENIALGHLEGKDFGLAPGAINFGFDTDYERLWSTGFIIDLSDVIALGLRQIGR